MKLKVLYIATALFLTNIATAQVLYTENFNNLAVGEVSTDPTGVTPGKGGWFVEKIMTPTTFPVEIVPEVGRGNVLIIGSNKNNTNGNGNGANLIQKNINTLWNNRTVGNNVLKLEYEVYLLGNSQYAIESVVALRNTSNIWMERIVIANYYNSKTPSTPQAHLYSEYYDLSPTPVNKRLNLGSNNTPDYDNFPYNTWLSVELFIDYTYEAGTINGGKIYVYIPTLNILKTANFTHTEVIELLNIYGFGGGDFSLAIKYDNIKLTALKVLPSYILNTPDFISNKFNLFPNPATDIITITNNENIGIEKIEVYDVMGKQLQTTLYNGAHEVQLNTSDLSVGTYLLHITTNEGVGIKKLIKK
ncbi:MAG TPA: T9SS type A sorting domain-containing protein [Flavobacterium sp.]|nr:T9SS type A sorting domain-containing protein [Flavobacterium sp.]